MAAHSDFSGSGGAVEVTPFAALRLVLGSLLSAWHELLVITGQTDRHHVHSPGCTE